MTREEVLGMLRADLALVRPDLSATAPPAARLREDLDIDSLDVVEFVARVEHRFAVVVPDEDWQQLGCLDDIAGYVLAAG